MVRVKWRLDLHTKQKKSIHRIRGIKGQGCDIDFKGIELLNAATKLQFDALETIVTLCETLVQTARYLLLSLDLR